jgi:hypothetical protein
MNSARSDQVVVLWLLLLRIKLPSRTAIDGTNCLMGGNCRYCTLYNCVALLYCITMCKNSRTSVHIYLDALRPRDISRLLVDFPAGSSCRKLNEKQSSVALIQIFVCSFSTFSTGSYFPAKIVAGNFVPG